MVSGLLRVISVLFRAVPVLTRMTPVLTKVISSLSSRMVLALSRVVSRISPLYFSRDMVISVHSIGIRELVLTAITRVAQPYLIIPPAP